MRGSRFESKSQVVARVAEKGDKRKSIEIPTPNYLLH
jgi:hypothetical protein